MKRIFLIFIVLAGFLIPAFSEGNYKEFHYYDDNSNFECLCMDYIDYEAIEQFLLYKGFRADETEKLIDKLKDAEWEETPNIESAVDIIKALDEYKFVLEAGKTDTASNVTIFSKANNKYAMKYALNIDFEKLIFEDF